MSTIVNRMAAKGEFQVGNAKFVILNTRGGLMQIVQTHSAADGVLLPEFQQVNDNGRFVFPDGFTSFPNGYIIPQTHSALNVIKASIESLDSYNMTICPQCDANGVTLQDFGDACESCVANINTISFLKSL